jgi:signal transduction histidine kinase
MESFTMSRIAALEILADRWVERQPPDFSRQRFLAFAETLSRRYPGITAINWVDPDGYIRWVFPETMKAAAAGKNLREQSDSLRRNMPPGAKQGDEYAVTPCTELYQQGEGFEVLIPLKYEGTLQGYVNGVFHVKRIMDAVVPSGVADSFCTEVYEEGRPIYQSGGKDCGRSATNGYHTLREVHFAGKLWRVDMEPNTAVYDPTDLKNLPLLAFGLALAGALSLLLYFLLQRMGMYKESRDLALHEVSERKRVEAALRENEKKLENTLTELSATNAEMESFVYTVSHDLKTPIVTIEGFIGALREDFGSVLGQEGERHLRYMSDAAVRMEALINDLLNLSRIGRVTEEKKMIPYTVVVKESLAMLRPQIEGRGIEAHIDDNLEGICVYGERKRLNQVLDNLLANAVKYMGIDNPAPRIDIGAENKNGQTVFFIRDNGIGIDERYHDKIFQIFERLPAAKKVSGGTGIGLTIVKRIVEYHGGKVWLTSKPGEGATFFFTLKQKDV